MTYNPRWTLNGLDLTDVPFGVMRDEADPGTAETVSSILASMISDGDIELTQRRGNRTYSLPVVIEGEDRATIATAQADLVAAVEQPLGTLEFDPGDGSDVTVFETFAGTVALGNGIDDDGATNGLQRLTVTIPCWPFVRSATEVTLAAPPVPPSGGTPPADVVIADGSSTTGWTSVNVTGVSGSAVANSVGHNVAPFTGMVYATQSLTNVRGKRPAAELKRAAALTFDATRPYLVINGYARVRDHSSPTWDTRTQIEIASGSGLSEFEIVSLTQSNGSFQAVLQQTATLTQGITILAKFTGSTFPATWDGQVGVSMRQTAGAVAGVFTGKAQSRQVPIYGSQRTELSLSILGRDTDGTATDDLGEQTLIHTGSVGTDGVAKFLGCRAQSGNLGDGGDTAAVSGVYNLLDVTTGSPAVFTFLASAVLSGEWDLFGRLDASAAASHAISFAAEVDAASVALSAVDPVSGWKSVTLPLTTSYAIYPLGTLMLPPAQIEDPAATLSIKFAADVASVVRLDEVWIAHRESGQVTLLNTAGGITDVRLDAATVDNPTPSVWVGFADLTAGTTQWIAAGSRIQAFDQHMAERGLLQISTVTPGCATSRVSASYFPRFAHDVAPVPA